jgi:uncharacterized protein with FMN-binding domain
MKRAAIVIGATAAGLAAVLSFHTAAAPTSLSFPSASAPAPSASAPSGSTSTPVATGPPSKGTGAQSGTSGPPTSGSSTPTRSPPPTTSSAANSGTRTATGATADYGYGTISVSVTVTGSRIANVAIASLDDGGNYRSVSIDEQAIPILEQQALQAQSANIQGVSGATYTSQGFAQSLQSALGQLGR